MGSIYYTHTHLIHTHTKRQIQIFQNDSECVNDTSCLPSHRFLAAPVANPLKPLVVLWLSVTGGGTGKKGPDDHILNR